MARPVRPDRVYRTSVLSPIVGYQPGAAVQSVATAFTSGGTQLQLGAAPLSAWQRFKLRVRMAGSERRARRMMQQLAKLGLQPQQSAPMAGLHGAEPARQGMATMAAQISAGMPPLPQGARTRLQAGSAIIPQSSGVPFQLSQQAVTGAPPYVAERAGVDGGDVLAADLMTHDLTPSRLIGVEGELISAPRLDNQGTCYAGLEAFLAADSAQQRAMAAENEGADND